jgi:hypothetical protein
MLCGRAELGGSATENAKFESWDAIFQVIERRRANKADRKWLEQFRKGR